MLTPKSKGSHEALCLFVHVWKQLASHFGGPSSIPHTSGLLRSSPTVQIPEFLQIYIGLQSLVGCSPWGLEESDTTEWLLFHFSLSCTGEGNGNPLQCSCLGNCRDGGACWAALYGVTQSRTRLKRLSSSSSSHPYITPRHLEGFVIPFRWEQSAKCPQCNGPVWYKYD